MARKEWLLLLGIIALMIAFYFGTVEFLNFFVANANDAKRVPSQFLALLVLAFFALMLFSNFVGSLGFFFYARDLPMVLTFPVSAWQFFLARLIITATNSGWVFFLFCFPTLIAYYTVFDLPWHFLISALTVSIPLALIPAALGVALAILLIRFLPLHSIQDWLLVGCVVLIFAASWVMGRAPVSGPVAPEGLADLGEMLSKLENPDLAFMPTRYAAKLLLAYLDPSFSQTIISIVMLISWTIGSLMLSFLIFDYCYFEAWTRSLKGRRTWRIAPSPLLATLGSALIPFNQQLRALFYKDMKMFFRDTTQWVQLVLLLVLTFVYLYNFRGLRLAPHFGKEVLPWWQTLLSLANIALGGCVLAAIATRFVFPAVSLEGQAYWVVRCAPLSLAQLLRNKFFIWLIPISLIAILLFVTGGVAIQLPRVAIVICGALALAISIGIVGLAVGLGAIYARFDWESSSQISASFGSLIFMLLALALVACSLVPTLLIVILHTIPNISMRLGATDYRLAMISGAFLVFFLNFITARWALRAGTEALARLEN